MDCRGRSKYSSARLVATQPEDQNDNNDERSFNVDVGPAPDEPDFSPQI